MCGIIGVVCYSGLTEWHFKKFTEMLVRAQQRGSHATGVFASSMRMLKAPLPSSIFVTAEKYLSFIEQAKADGVTYLIGHCRHATRGDPKNNINNHPLAPNDKSFMLVHNGVVNCKKYDKVPENTDTFIFVEAISQAFAANQEQTLYQAIKASFEDIERCTKNNSSVIVAANTSEVVFCKSNTSPLIFEELPETETLIFASTSDIMQAEPNAVNERGSKVKRWEEVNNEVVIGFDLSTKEKKVEWLATKALPTFTVQREMFDYSDVDLGDFEKSQGGKWVRKGTTQSQLPGTNVSVTATPLFVDEPASQPGKKKHRYHGSKKNRRKQREKEKQDKESWMKQWNNTPSTVDTSSEKLIDDFITNEVEIKRKNRSDVTCFDCDSCADIENEEELLLRIRTGLVECDAFGYEMDKSEAMKCPFFAPKDYVDDVC